MSGEQDSTRLSHTVGAARFDSVPVLRPTGAINPSPRSLNGHRIPSLNVVKKGQRRQSAKRTQTTVAIPSWHHTGGAVHSSAVAGDYDYTRGQRTPPGPVGA